MSNEQVKHVVVLGAGVIGLTTALSIQERSGYKVTIVAEFLPTDPKSIKYTSKWAGAHHVSHADNNTRQQTIDQNTFKAFLELAKPGGAAEHCFMHVHQQEFYHEIPTGEHHLSWYPDFQIIDKKNLRPHTNFGVEFNTITIDTPAYTNYLLSRFISAGGSVVRGVVQHLDQILEGGAGVFSDPRRPTPVDAIVVCTGIGTRTLGGIEDRDVHPIRGQTVILRAPWIKFGRTTVDAEGLSTYIIPRPSGDVIVGGTKVANDWYPIARPENAEDILNRAFRLCPELAPPEIRAKRTPTVEDLRPIIIEHGVGHRPARKGGIRLETLWFQGKNKKVPVVTNYGHGAGGFQSSWESSSIAVGLLEDALSKPKL